MSKRVVMGAVLACMSTAAAAQDSAQYAQMSRTSWDAFACAALASTMQWRERHDQLVNYGYAQGKTFLTALAAGKIKQYDTFSRTPSAFPMRGADPSPDFVLGRVYEMAKTHALRDVVTPENRGQDDLQKSLATTKYETLQCKAHS
ncbi:hypothetical protein [Lysobacter humi (ex Lee et al. 2017)]